VRYKKLDLNLLVALDALLTFQSVSQAAAAVHVTQPAMSSSLAHLREYFGDPLLVPAGKKMVPTPLALSLAEPMRRTMESVDATLSHRPRFEPETARRSFVIAASDYSALAILQPVAALLAHAAPGITLETVPVAPQLTSESLRRREIDFSLLPEEFLLPEHPSLFVVKVDFCCAVWKGNTEIGKSLSPEQYVHAGHVVTHYGPERRAGFEQTTLDRLGITRREEIVCPTPLLLCPMLVGTNRIATLMKPLAAAQARSLPIRSVPAPFDFVPLRLALQWHRTRESDGGMAWFRKMVAQAASAAELRY